MLPVTDLERLAQDLALPPLPATVHFIGIGGISMSGLAQVLLLDGFKVTGSDASDSAIVQGLREKGVEIVIGHDDPRLASQADLVVSTLRAELHAATELAAARERGAVIASRGQLLGMMANPRREIAVAGTHGKSTTSGMLAIGLIGLDLDPGFAVGAVLPGQGTNTARGSGEFMVVEADEFSRSFLWLKPEVSIITAVSFDHPDIYADQADYDGAFLQFARNTRPGGTLVIAADDGGCSRTVAALREDRGLQFAVVTFGESNEADWRLSRVDDGWNFRSPEGTDYPANLSVPGKHNARNAIAAVAALHSVGFTPREAIDAIEPFTGVGRRFEHKGTVGGVDVVDDYAHHPEEIAAAIAAARLQYPGRRVMVVHQPHTYSRTRALLPEFAESLNTADEVILLEIYPSGETDSLGISHHSVLEKVTVSSHAAKGPEDAGTLASSLTQPGDVILTLGAGDITKAGAVILQTLQANAAEVPSEVPIIAKRKRAPIATVTIPEAPHLKVMRDAAMSMYTTMRAGGTADFVVRAPTEADVVSAMRWAASEGLSATVIGGGSNLLVADAGIRGLVIVARTPGERADALLTTKDLGHRVEVTVGAQAPLSWVGRYCAEQGWAGMDWGVGLPGQVGGATVNNAGAHGTELKDHLTAIDLLLESGEVQRVTRDWLEARYRMTKIKESQRPREWIVLRSVFELPKDDPARLVALADDHAAFRKRTQPTGACSGSTFANPEGDFAGRLLEAAGLKGFSIGSMQFSPKHANWVVNSGGGKASEAWELILHAQETVMERYGVLLRPEVERVGDW
jgi:UDP-N-acetylmuramate--alanine ligase